MTALSRISTQRGLAVLHFVVTLGFLLAFGLTLGLASVAEHSTSHGNGALDITVSLTILTTIGLLVFPYRRLKAILRERENAHGDPLRHPEPIKVLFWETPQSVVMWLSPFLTIGLATAMRYALDPWIGSGIPFGLFFLAIAITALTAGFKPALLSVVLALFAANSFFLEPSNNSLLSSPQEIWVLVLLTVTGTAIALLGRQLQRYQAKVETSVRVFRRQAILLDEIPAAVFLRSKAGVVRTWNKGAEKLYGWTAEEAVGKIIYELLHTKFPEPLERIIKRLEEGGRIGPASWYIGRRTARWFMSRASGMQSALTATSKS